MIETLRSLGWWKITGLGIALFALVQAVSLPAVLRQTNPPVVQEPMWDSPTTRDLAQRACYDCHSNETNWAWYAKSTPAAWLIVHDVEEGRAALNFSEWGTAGEEGDEMAEEIAEGEMPLWFYLPLHPEANLTSVEQQQLMDGLRTLGAGNDYGEEGAGDDDERDDDDD